MKKIVITNNDKYGRITAVYENDILIGLRFEDDNVSEGDVIVSKVMEKTDGIGAYFVKLTDNEKGFLRTDKELKVGDKLPVRIKKEKTGNKCAVVTDRISLIGDYTVLDMKETGVSISRKIEDEAFKKKIKSEINAEGLIVRTKSYSQYLKTGNIDFIKEEAKKLKEIIYVVKNNSSYLKEGTIIYKSNPPWKSGIDDEAIIITDDKSVYDECVDSLRNIEMRYYDDDYSLSKLYGIEGDIKRLFEKRVWLKSGANIVIEETESLTSIDINTAKYERGSKKEDTFLKINTEALREIIRQIILREISGIIIVDFINMKSKESINLLENEIDKVLQEMPYSDIVFYGFTKLGLGEFSRRRKRPSLKERWRKYE